MLHAQPVRSFAFGGLLMDPWEMEPLAPLPNSSTQSERPPYAGTPSIAPHSRWALSAALGFLVIAALLLTNCGGSPTEGAGAAAQRTATAQAQLSASSAATTPSSVATT